MKNGAICCQLLVVRTEGRKNWARDVQQLLYNLSLRSD